MNDKLLLRLQEAEKYFLDTPFEKCVRNAWNLFESGESVEAAIELGKLPTKEQLLSQLIEKLKGKSVYQTLERINAGKTNSPEDFLKGLFSLCTHIVIECQQGHKEYRILLPMIYNQIGNLIYSLK
jgi:hypothetical protein